MSGLPADALGLAALVFLLGLRHGLDPDHLVAIDGLTRAGTREGARRWCGLFFSLGHGLVITLVGLAVAIAATEWQAPAWLRALGTSVSVGVLLVLGLANLAMAWRTPSQRPVPLVGMRGRWLAEQVSRGSHPAFIAAIGAAFALSFDTISHALAFSLTGAALAGWLFATLLGLVFTLGMALVDALNGLWVAKTTRSGGGAFPLGGRAVLRVRHTAGHPRERRGVHERRGERRPTRALALDGGAEGRRAQATARQARRGRARGREVRR